MTRTAAVWLLDCRRIPDTDLAPFTGWLGPSEQQRLARFVRHERRRQFIAGRALLRLSLGRLLGIAASDVRLLERPGNAPLLDLPGTEMARFSLSHSGSWVACAVSADTALGLDIEVIDPARDVMALARQAFGAEKASWLAACPPENRLRAFYEMWCAHEARIKLACAEGHDYVLSHPDFAAVLRSEHPLTTLPELSLRSLDP